MLVSREHAIQRFAPRPYWELRGDFTTSDGLLLKGWYIRSRNGAAVISFPGRSGTQARARLLARGR